MTDDNELIAPAVYSRWRNSVLGAITEQLESEAITAMLPDALGARLLDAGCGDGTYSVQQARRGALVTALDLSMPMLAAARQRAIDAGAAVKWCQGDIEALPFAESCFDIVLAVTVLCMVRSPERAVQELARVLRPGGVLVIGELGQWSLWAASRRLRGWFGSRSWQHAHFWSLSELRRLTTRAGLNRIATSGAVYYPPCGLAAKLFKPCDSILSRLGGLGAAFLVVEAEKPR